MEEEKSGGGRVEADGGSGEWKRREEGAESGRGERR